MRHVAQTHYCTAAQPELWIEVLEESPWWAHLVVSGKVGD